MNRCLLFVLTAHLCLLHSNAQPLFKWKPRLSSPGLTVGINPLNPNSVYAQNSSGQLLISFDRGITWQGRGTLPISQIRQVLVHPSDTTVILCAAFFGSMQRTTDYGLTWTTVLPDFGIDGESIAMDPIHPDTLYAGNFQNGNIYRSTNRGASWAQVGTTGVEICAFVVRSDSTNILLAGTGGGRISKSTNAGATWRVVKPEGSDEIPKIVINRITPTVAYGAAYEGPESTTGIWKSTNGGESWFRSALQARSIWALDIDNLDPSVVYGGTFSEAGATVFTTTDGGNSWTSLSRGIPPNANAWSLKVHPLNSGVIWLAVSGNRSGIYQYLVTRTIVRGVVRDDVTGDTIRNGVIINTSTGDTVDLATSRGTFEFGFFPGDPTVLPILRVHSYPYYVTDVQIHFVLDSAIVHDARLQRLPTANIMGTIRDSLTQQPIRATVILHATTLIGSTILTDSTDVSGAFRFNNQFISHSPIVRYDQLDIYPAIPYGHNVIPSFTLVPGGVSFQTLLRGADVFLVSADSGRFAGFYQSTLDSLRVSWNPWDLSRQGAAPLSLLGMFRKNILIYYTGNKSVPFSTAEAESIVACMNAGGNIFLTGQNITEANDSSTLVRNYLGVRFDGNIPALNVWGSGDGLFDGNTFSVIGSGGANNQSSKDKLVVTQSSVQPVLSYVPGGQSAIAGVRRGDGGRKTVFFGFGFEGISSVSSRLYVMQRVVGYLDGSITVNAIENREAGLPTEFRLGQNYPNPFNPSTTIAFDAPRKTHVLLTVYNLLGQQVALLVNDEREAGRHSVLFSAEGLSSGVYIYRLTAEGFAAIRKLLIVK